MLFNSIYLLRMAAVLGYILQQNLMFIQGDIYMKVTFVDVDRDTLYLLPPSIQEWLPEQHLARFVVEIVEQINLQSLKSSYCGRGSQPYNPEMLVALLFYGTQQGFFRVVSWSAVPMTLWLSGTSPPTVIPTMIRSLLSVGVFCPS